MPAPKGVSTEKYDRCIKDVGNKRGINRYAVCAASLKRAKRRGKRR